MAYILDAVVILIVALSVFDGWRRGFVRMLILLVGSIAAVLVAGWLSAPVAEQIYNSFVETRLEDSLIQKAQESAGAPVTIDLKNLFGEGGEPIARFLADNGMTESITVEFEDLSDDTVRAAIAPAMTTVVRPAMISLITAAAAVLLFLLLLAVVSLAARLVDKVFELPVLRQLNHAGGLAVGLVQGVLWALLFCAALALGARCGLFGSVVTPETIDGSHLVTALCEYIPII